MAGLIFDDRVYNQIKALISFIGLGTIGAALGGAAGFFIEGGSHWPYGFLIGAAVGSILGNIIRVLLIDESFLRGRKLVVLFAILFISIPAGAILGLGLSYIGIIIFLNLCDYC